LTAATDCAADLLCGLLLMIIVCLISQKLVIRSAMAGAAKD
jgi:hypothetical protein